jgi:glutaconate CoA-transferase, subunit A
VTGRGDLTTTAAAAIELIPDGPVVGIGGNSQSRKPMTLIRELVRARRRDLEVVTFLGSIDVEYLLAGGCLRRLRAGYVGFDLAGLAPLHRSAPAELIQPETEASLLLGLQAAALQLDFLPARGTLHTDLRALRPDAQTVRSPYSGQQLMAWPAIPLDVALLHVPVCDRQGTAQISGAPFVDKLLSEVATTTIISAETVSDTPLWPGGATVVRRDRTRAVVPAPWGAHPTGCYPGYRCDGPALWQHAYRDADEARRQALALCELAEDEYRSRIDEQLLRVA